MMFRLYKTPPSGRGLLVTVTFGSEMEFRMVPFIFHPIPSAVECRHRKLTSSPVVTFHDDGLVIKSKK